jgi:uncharacterized protein (DUF697 family)
MSNVTIQEGPRFVAEVVAPGRFAVVATGITILDGGGVVTWDDVEDKPTEFPPADHAHAIDDVTGLQDALDDKQAAGNYAAASHTHLANQVSDFAAAVSANSDVAANTAARHTHSNMSVLNAIQEAFTTVLKNAYDAVVTWVTTNGANVLAHLVNTSNPHSVTKSQVGLGNVDNTSDLSKPVSTAQQTALNAKAATTHTHAISDTTGLQTALNALSPSNNLSDIATSVGLPACGGNVLFSPLFITTANSLADGQLRGDLVYIEKDITVSGVWFYLQTSGVFTGDNVNSIALYSISGGIATKIAETANDSSIWTGTANAWKNVAFATPVAVTKGDYYITFLYNNSAQTTAPGLGGGAALFNAAVANIFPNSTRIVFNITGQSTQPSSLTLSTTSNTVQSRNVIVY